MRGDSIRNKFSDQIVSGHSFRRTSATILANSGADMETIMRHGGWRNESCAKGYIEDSLAYKAKTGKMIQHAILGESAQPQPPIARNDCGADYFDPSFEDSVLIDIVDQASQPVLPDNGRFDASIDDAVLVDIVDQASQSMLPETDRFEASIDDSVLIDIVDRASQSGHRNDTRLQNRPVNAGGIDSSATKRRKIEVTGGTCLADSSNNSSTLNTVLSSTLKSAVNFDKIENCTFNFYLTK